jgi:hypothetical protein
VPIATVADVEAALVRSLEPAEAEHIDALLSVADARIAEELPGVRFTGILTNQTAVLRGDGDVEVWLPGRPVRKVTSVTVDGSPLGPAYYLWHDFGDLTRIGGPGRWLYGQSIVVNYDFGWPGPPAPVVSVAAELVKRWLSAPAGVRQESIGQYSTTYATAEGVPDDLRRTLDRYRYPVKF